MKRIISILLAIATLLTLTACGKKDSGKVQTSSKGETTTQSPAKETKSEEVEPIENYLVKVELTPENFDDYFEWKCVHRLDDWGDMMEEVDVRLKSKAYDDGLIIYECPDDVKFEYNYHPDDDSDYYTTDTLQDWFLFGSAGLYGNGCYFETDDGFNKEEKTCTYGNIHPFPWHKLGRVKGTITYVKAEYIDHIEKTDEVEDYGGNYYGHKLYEVKIYLKNGEVIRHYGLEEFLLY